MQAITKPADDPPGPFHDGPSQLVRGTECVCKIQESQDDQSADQEGKKRRARPRMHAHLLGAVLLQSTSDWTNPTHNKPNPFRGSHFHSTCKPKAG